MIFNFLKENLRLIISISMFGFISTGLFLIFYYYSLISYNTLKSIFFFMLFFIFNWIQGTIITKNNRLMNREKRIKRIEKKLEEHPDRSKYSWDLAREKLEKYIERNLDQIRYIFILTVLVMTSGFGLIVYGIYTFFENPAVFTGTIISTVAGGILNFIGATFLVIYKSSITQAKEYMQILENINAVGMSIQIAEKIDDEKSVLKYQTMAEISKGLLELYWVRNCD